MDFNDTPEEAKFRKEVSDWLKENVKKAIYLLRIDK